ncbi:type II toxin-antitoxin system HicB family antitoxin [Alkaliphilus transvaalensis]|uniref:type II toxin-antitoxin system HicB family antitoxin n=1 Tax=Alkaliphilus transvaalensis TaxID=114628 RepID=UPI0005565A8E|nr:hypothetical protein [Alkaliphilus transvaalensis]
MKNKSKIIINWNEKKQRFIADAPDLPDCIAEGDNSMEALKALEDLISMSELEENKAKRSFMLKESQIDKLEQVRSTLKYKKNLSTIVGEAIEQYYEQISK